MENQFKKIFQSGFIAIALWMLVFNLSAQYKDFSLSPKGDTLNAIDKKGLKQGKWVISVAELRGEPGYDEEGFYKNDKKSGTWRRYNSTGDILAIENYRFGGKDGLQEYFSFLGDLQRQEEWHAYNPDVPFDTIAVYGTGSNEILNYKIVRAEQYSVPNGEWKYYEGGRLIKFEKYDRGRLLKKDNGEDQKSTDVVAKTAEETPKQKVKTKEILEYEKKYSKKKRKKLERDGQTGL